MRSLIAGLCTVNVAHRLGYLKGGALDIIEHEWLRTFDWDGLINRTIAPPWQPGLSAADDTQHFDKFEDEPENGSSVKASASDEECWAKLCEAYSEGSVADIKLLNW